MKVLLKLLKKAEKHAKATDVDIKEVTKELCESINNLAPGDRELVCQVLRDMVEELKC